MEKKSKRGRPIKSVYQREGLLKTLMDEYDVALLPDEGSKVNVFREGLNYVTSFDLIKDGDFYKYQYNGEVYNAFSKMLKQAEKDNENKPFPSYVYCPITREPYKVLHYVRDYMESIGFTILQWGEEFCHTSGRGDSFVMKNIYNEPISHITVLMDDWEKGTSGKVYREIGNRWSWCEVPFKGFDDVLGAINSLLEPEVLTNAARYIASSSNLSSERKDEVQGVVVSPNLDVMKSDMKKQVISILEKTLERLKSNC
jgi:hypothetical protein